MAEDHDPEMEGSISSPPKAPSPAKMKSSMKKEKTQKMASGDKETALDGDDGPLHPPRMNMSETQATSLSETERTVPDGGDDRGGAKEAGDGASPLQRNCLGQAVTPPAEDAAHLTGPMERISKGVARSPCTYLWASLLVSVALSVIAIIVGEFSVSAETGGWNSRGTLIADRQTQIMLATEFREYLFYGGDAAWEDLINNVQPGWESEDDDNNGRRLAGAVTPSSSAGGGVVPTDHVQYPAASLVDYLRPKTTTTAQPQQQQQPRRLPFLMTPHLKRRLQDAAAANNSTGVGIANCDTSFYEDGNLTDVSRLWPVWKTATTSSSGDVDSVLDPALLRDVCVAEENTQRQLEELGLCFGCPDGRCLPPYSVVFYARLVLPDGFSLSCDELADAWGPVQETTQEEWKVCIDVLKKTYDPAEETLPEECPLGFYPSLVQTNFDETMVTSYSSSIFATREDQIEELYAVVDSFDRGSEDVVGAYDTQYEDFVNIYADDSLTNDMALAREYTTIMCLAARCFVCVCDRVLVFTSLEGFLPTHISHFVPSPLPVSSLLLALRMINTQWVRPWWLVWRF